MTDRPRADLSATVLGTPDPRALAAFYSALLSWPIAYDDPEWAMVKRADGGWRRPVVPARAGPRAARRGPPVPATSRCRRTSTSRSTTSRPASPTPSASGPPWPSTSLRTTSAS